MFFSTSPLPFCRQLINNKQLGDIEVLKRLKGAIGKGANELAKMASKTTRREPPKRFDAMTEGRKVSQAKKQVEAKKKRDKKFSDIGKSMIAFLQTGDTKTPKRKKGGGKIYASTDKKYGGGIFPRKGKM